jgi:hypothetical protein
MPSNESDSGHKKRSSKRRSLLPLLIILVIALMISSSVLIFLVRNHANAAKGENGMTRLSLQSGFACEYSEAQKLYPFAKGVLKVTATRVAYLSISGKEIYGFDIQMDNPFCVIKDDHALVADAGGFFCALFDEKGMICKEQLSGAIRFGALSTGGMAGLIIEFPQTKGAVYLLSATGEFIAQWNSVESGYPVSLSFSPDQKRVDISLLDTDGSAIQPRLKQIGIPAGGTDQSVFEIALYTPDISTILSSISYIGSDVTLLAGTSDVVSFSSDNTQVLTESYSQILSMLPVGSGTAVIYSYGVGQEIRLTYLRSDSTDNEGIVIGNRYIDSDTWGNKMLLAVDNKIIVVQASNLEISKTITVDEEIIRIGFIDEDTIVVISISGVYQLEL